MADTTIVKSEESKKRQLPLRTNFAWVFMGNVIFSGIQFAIVVVLGRFCGGEEAIGRYAMATSIAIPLTNCFGLQLRAIYLSDVDKRHPFGSYMALRLLFIPFIYVGSVVWLKILGQPFSELGVLFLVVTFRVLEYITDIIFSIFQRENQMDYLGKSRFWFLLGVLAAFGGIFVFKGGLEWFMLGLIIAEIVILGFYLLPASRHFTSPRPIWSKSDLFTLFKTGLPMGGTLFLLSIGSFIPRYFILWIWRGDKKYAMMLLGQFSVATQIIVIQTLFLSAFGQAIAPRLAETFKNKTQAFWGLFLKGLIAFVLVSLVIAVVLFCYGPQLLLLLFKVSFDDSEIVMKLIAANCLLLAIGSFLGITLTATRIFKAQFVVKLLHVVILIVFSLLTLPSMKLIGGVISLMAGNVLTIILCSIVLTRKIRTENRSEIKI